jgi:hypothetical protein
VKSHPGTTSRRPTTLDDEVVGWRHEQLVGAGFEYDLAGELAVDPRLDLHALIELVERGCPPELAARILSPIDGPPAAVRFHNSQPVSVAYTRR